MKSTEKKYNKFNDAVSRFGGYVVVLAGLSVLLRIFELFSNHVSQLLNSESLWNYYSTAFYFDLVYLFFLTPILFFVFLICYWRSTRLARYVTIVLCSLIVIVHAMLINYFSTALNPLGADLFHYSLREIKQTAGAAITGAITVLLVFGLVLVVLSFLFLPGYLRLPKKLTYGFLVVSMLSFFFVGIAPAKNTADFGSEFLNSSMINKSAFFYREAFYYLSDREPEENLPLFADYFLGYDGKSNGRIEDQFVFPDPENYPFLHEENSAEVFSSFFKSSDTPPDIVIIIVEGLGRAFSNENAYLGSFTPFLDSLSSHSLYWENCLSTSGRTFSVLPSLLASLPFGEHGFAEMGEEMPPHQSLIKLLRFNGYHSRFIYAGDSEFDNMKLFMERQQCDEIIDKNNFGNGYELLPGNANGFSWGYGDFELYRRFFKELDSTSEKSPSVNVLLTVATHNPFLVNNQDYYRKQFQNILPSLKLNEQMKTLCRNYQQQLETVLYMDDALRNFFKEYRKRDSFENTIFVITGDHRMPDIPMSTRIDRYHVPLIIYSPLIERPTRFSSVVSHFDLTPSLTVFLENEYQFDMPDLNCWIGTGLDSTVVFSSKSTFPLMQTKTDQNDLVSGEYFLDSQKLFRLIPNMGLVEDDDPEIFDRLNLDLKKFKLKNSQFLQSHKLYPDSIISKYMGTGGQLD